jgi:DNA-binding NarL/FixJ family response regulator
VLKLLAAGWNTAEIAERLGKSRSTVQLQSRFCLFRLGTVNIPHAVALAYA